MTSTGNTLVAHEMFLNFWWYRNSAKLANSRTRALNLGLDTYDLYAGIWTENYRKYGVTPTRTATTSSTSPGTTSSPRTSRTIFRSRCMEEKRRSLNPIPTPSGAPRKCGLSSHDSKFQRFHCAFDRLLANMHPLNGLIRNWRLKISQSDYSTSLESKSRQTGILCSQDRCFISHE